MIREDRHRPEIRQRPWRVRAALLAAAAILGSRAASCGEMLYISHRGESLDAPENTMAAFRLSLDHGADGFECDVWLTADKRIACIHDSTTWRTSGYTTNLTVTASTLADLRALDVGSWKSAVYAGEKIPTLEEVLSLARDGSLIYVEIKQSASSGIVPYIKAIVEAEPRATPDRIVFISFQGTSITAIREALPGYRACWLHYYSTYASNAAGLVTTLSAMNATGFSGGYYGEDISGQISALRDAGFSAHVWTVDQADLAIRCAAYGIDSLTSNCARRMMDNVFGEAVAHDWLDAYPDLLAQHTNDYRAAAMATTGKFDARGREMNVWEDFIAGTCPTNPASRFRCFVTMEGGQPIVT